MEMERNRDRKEDDCLSVFQTESRAVGKLYSRGETLYFPGDEDCAVYLIASGGVKLAHLDQSGRKLTIAILGRGELFGEMALVGQKKRESLAQIIEKAWIYRIGVDVFFDLVRREPWLAFRILELFGQRRKQIERKLTDLIFKPIPMRLCRQLVELMEGYGVRTSSDSIQLNLRISHKDLAEMIGAARENVTRVLNQLERAGIITKRPWRIVITDENRLRQTAEV